MYNIFKTIAVIHIILLLSSSIYSQIKTDEIYFGSKIPGMHPEIFGQGEVCLDNRIETKIVFSPNYSECLICVSDHKLLYSKFIDGKWTKPEPPYFIIEGKGGEPFFSPNGEQLFFEKNADIWRCKKINGHWGEQERLGTPINTDAWEWHPSVSDSGTLYFCSNRDRRDKKEFRHEIYKSLLIDGEYKTVEKLDTVINTYYGAHDPYIDPEESYLLFGSYRPGGFGKQDLFMSKKINDKWTSPRILNSTINTDQIEYGAYVSPDKKYLFFTRLDEWSENSSSDIYWVDINLIYE